MDSTAFYKSVTYLYPSNAQLIHMSLSLFLEMWKGYIKKQMHRIPYSILTCGHTFEVSKHNMLTWRGTQMMP